MAATGVYEKCGITIRIRITIRKAID